MHDKGWGFKPLIIILPCDYKQALEKYPKVFKKLPWPLNQTESNEPNTGGSDPEIVTLMSASFPTTPCAYNTIRQEREWTAHGLAWPGPTIISFQCSSPAIEENNTNNPIWHVPLLSSLPITLTSSLPLLQPYFFFVILR